MTGVQTCALPISARKAWDNVLFEVPRVEAALPSLGLTCFRTASPISHAKGQRAVPLLPFSCRPTRRCFSFSDAFDEAPSPPDPRGSSPSSVSSSLGTFSLSLPFHLQSGWRAAKRRCCGRVRHRVLLAVPGNALICSCSQIWTPSMYGVGSNWDYTAGDPVTPLGPGVAKQDDWWFRFVTINPAAVPS